MDREGGRKPATVELCSGGSFVASTQEGPPFQGHLTLQNDCWQQSAGGAVRCPLKEAAITNMLRIVSGSAQFLARFEREAFERAIGRERIVAGKGDNVIWHSANMISHRGLSGLRFVVGFFRILSLADPPPPPQFQGLSLVIQAQNALQTPLLPLF